MMMKQFQQIISGWLVICLLVYTLPLGALASETAPVLETIPKTTVFETEESTAAETTEIAESTASVETENTIETTAVTECVYEDTETVVFSDDRPFPSPLETPVEVTDSGDGSSDNPYRIDSGDDFDIIVMEPDAHYILAKDITLDYHWEVEFTGVLDGNHHTLTLVDGAAAGIFRENSGTIKNLNLYVDSSLDTTNTDETSIGCVCSINSGVIKDCTVQGSLSVGFPQYETDCHHIGSIAGNNLGEIKRCWSALDISTDIAVSNLYIGGIAGEVVGSITQCLNTGNISATVDCSNLTLVQNAGIARFYAGGIAGRADYNSKIENCIQAGETINVCTVVLVDHYGLIVIDHDLQCGFVLGGEYSYGSVQGVPVSTYVSDCQVYVNSQINQDYHSYNYDIYDKKQYLAESDSYPTVRYIDVEDWWDGLERKADVPADDKDSEDNQPDICVYYFRKWDPETQTAYWGEELSDFDMGSQVTEETDMSFIADINNLVGTYVLVEIRELNGENILLSIKPVNTAIGIVTAMSSEDNKEIAIAIDGTSYALDDGIQTTIAVGDVVRYHLYNGELVGSVTKLELSMSGTATYWDADTKQITIDSVQYTLSSHADEVSLSLLGDTGEKNLVIKFIAQDGVVCKLRGYDATEPEYRFVLDPDVENLTVVTGQTLEINCYLYCNDEIVTDWEKPQSSYSSVGSVNCVTYEGQ